jgi:hypothetical protein
MPTNWILGNKEVIMNNSLEISKWAENAKSKGLVDVRFCFTNVQNTNFNDLAGDALALLKHGENEYSEDINEIEEL